MSSIQSDFICFKEMSTAELRLEKIAKLEVSLATGKSLDEEQLILYSSKSNVEKAIADIGALKTQLEELALQVHQHTNEEID